MRVGATASVVELSSESRDAQPGRPRTRLIAESQARVPSAGQRRAAVEHSHCAQRACSAGQTKRHRWSHQECERMDAPASAETAASCSDLSVPPSACALISRVLLPVVACFSFLLPHCAVRVLSAVLLPEWPRETHRRMRARSGSQGRRSGSRTTDSNEGGGKKQGEAAAASERLLHPHPLLCVRDCAVPVAVWQGNSGTRSSRRERDGSAGNNTAEDERSAHRRTTTGTSSLSCRFGLQRITSSIHIKAQRVQCPNQWVVQCPTAARDECISQDRVKSSR